MTPMGDILNQHGSDKNLPGCHSYAYVYEELFPDRQAVTAVLELGIAYGGSLLAWRDIFPNAVIVGLDVDPCVPCPVLDRMEKHQGSQRDRDTLERCVGGRKFDLIIDDASHILHDQLFSLFILWPHLKPDGWYVIEELDIQNGRGPAANQEELKIFRGLKTYMTPGPGGPEMLAVIRKE